MIEWRVRVDPDPKRMRKYTHIRVPMRDGNALSTVIFLPAGKGPFPVILERTCYVIALGCPRAKLIRFEGKYWTDRGYAFVMQDVRGRGDSDGHFSPYLYDAADGADTIRWIADQSWCDGNIGTYGQSYSAYTAVAPLKEDVPALKAVFNSGIPGLWGRHLYGYVNNGTVNSWHLPWRYQVEGRQAQASTIYEEDPEDETRIDWNEMRMRLPVRSICQEVGQSMGDWLNLTVPEKAEELFRNLDFGELYEKADAAMMHVTGWLDLFEPTVSNYARFASRSRNRENQFLMVGPWTHFVLRNPDSPYVKSLYLGDEIVIDMYDLKHRFYDYYLKGQGDFPASQPRTSIYNVPDRRWYHSIDVCSWYDQEKEPESCTWFFGPSSQEREEQALQGAPSLSRERPEQSGYWEYPYDPEKPIFSPLIKDRTKEELQADLRWMQEREDLLVLKTEVLQESLRVSGKPALSIHVGSDCPDTDFIVLISDIFPDGTALNLNNSFTQRMRYRKGLTQVELLEKGKVYRLDFHLDAMDYTFKAGHRIALQIQSSWLDFVFRNLNNGRDDYGSTELRKAGNRVYYGNEFRSWITLPGGAE